MNWSVAAVGSILAVCVSIQYNRCAAGEEREPRQAELAIQDGFSGVTSLLEGVRQDPSDAAFQRLVAGAGLLLSSEQPGNSFAFDFCGRGPRGREPQSTVVQRFLFDSTPAHRLQVTLGATGLPVIVSVNDAVLCLRKDLPWELQRGAPWAFVADEKPAQAWTVVTDKQRAARGLIRLDLGGLLKTNVPRTLKWHSPTRTITLITDNGRVSQLRFRTPNDTIPFGTSLSQVAVRTPGGASVNWAGFIVGKSSYLRFQAADLDHLTKGIGEIHQRDFVDSPPPASVSTELDGPRRLWSNLVALPNHDRRRHSFSRSDIKSRFHEVLFAFAAYVENRMEQDLAVKSPGRPTEITAIAREAISELRQARKAVLAGLASEAGQTGPDDPLLMWRGFEFATSVRDARYIFVYGLQFLSQAPLESPDLRYDMYDALADLGTPCTDFIPSEHADRRIAEDPFAAAILHSHWQWECAPAEVGACVAQLTEANQGTGVERVAIEALVRMGLLDKIPAERLTAWFDAEVVQADEDVRVESLRILSLTPQGQQYLMRLATSNTLSKPIQAAILDMLVYRAEATLRTRRYDFLSEAACRRIVEMQSAFDKSPSK